MKVKNLINLCLCISYLSCTKGYVSQVNDLLLDSSYESKVSEEDETDITLDIKDGQMEQFADKSLDKIIDEIQEDHDSLVEKDTELDSEYGTDEEEDTEGQEIPVIIDMCPDDPLKLSPGVCGCGVSDIDSDLDGILDCKDECPNDPKKITPGICDCGKDDVDTDQDGTPNCIDFCPFDATKVEPGICGCGVPDLDSDGDNIMDCKDGCPNDIAKTSPGTCGCGVTDQDTDKDGVYDCKDECPEDPKKVFPGICGCGVEDKDTDYDTTPDCIDGCPDDKSKVMPGTCGCGVSDKDTDKDNIPDCKDQCPEDPDKIDIGICGCGVSDKDTDGDKTPDCIDQCPSDPKKTKPLLCGCGVGEDDTDKDKVVDCLDGCPMDPEKVTPGECGCGKPETPNCDEIDPPQPNPPVWAIEPHATGTTSVSMTVGVVMDKNKVEYYFQCVSGDCHDSGWQSDTTYEDFGLAPDNIYVYRVKARDLSLNKNETGWSKEASSKTDRDNGFASGLDAWYYDFNQPLNDIPNISDIQPAIKRIDSQIAWSSAIGAWKGLEGGFADTFASRHGGFIRIVEAGTYTFYLYADDGARLFIQGKMVADNIGKQPPMEVSVTQYVEQGYLPFQIQYFENTGPAVLILSWSKDGAEKQTIPSKYFYHLDPPDQSPPIPNPPQWDIEPTKTGTSSIKMRVKQVDDISGVQYYFECIGGGGHDSGWQSSNEYEDKGLQPGRQYTYRVRARDFSMNENKGDYSEPKSAFTDSIVPQVIGMPKDLAETTLLEAGLDIGEIKEEYHDTIPLGAVISQDPTANTILPAGSKVNLVISKGIEPVVVPNVENMTKEDAEKTILSAKLKVGKINYTASCNVAPQSVVSQQPKGGEMIPKGSSVNLVLSKGPEEVVINEIMYHPKNDDVAKEEFLELYNPCLFSIDLQGWKIEGLGGFTFGSQAVIPPFGYMVLAQDASAFQARYGFPPDFVYTGAKLSNDGESIKIITITGVVADEVTYDDLPPWPVTPDGLGPSLELIDPTKDNNSPRNWHASISAKGATPKAQNSVYNIGLPPWISNVSHGEAKPDQAIYVTAKVEDATSVTLTYVLNWGEAVTVDMKDDGQSNDGDKSDGIYGAMIPGQGVNTLIRYRIDAIGQTGTMGYPRDDDTVTYTGTYFPPSVNTDLEVFHWLIKPEDYQKALQHYNTDQTEPALLFHKGKLYDGVRIRVRGQSSRGWPKKHWNFEFAQGHEFSSPDLIDMPVNGFNLESSYSDKSYVREILSYETFRDAMAPSHIIFPVTVYQNGAFFGLYNCLEDKDRNYLQRNGLDQDGGFYKAFSSQCEYKTLSQLPGQWEKRSPDDGNFVELHDLLYGINKLSGQERRNFIYDNVDIPAMINYQAANVIIHNNDQPAKNYFLYRDSKGTGRWHMQVWDLDLTFGRNFQGAVLNDEIFADKDVIPNRPYVSPSHPLFGDAEHQKWDYLWNRMIDAILKDDDIRQMYYRRLRTLMDELLVEGKYEARIDELYAKIVDEAEMDRQKWGWYGVAETPAKAVERLKTEYLAKRRIHLFQTHRVPQEIPEAQSPNPVIVINEIMYHPFEDPNDPPEEQGEAEFIELYNPSATEAVDISGWSFEGVDLILPGGCVILPNSYALVVRNDVVFRKKYGSGKFILAQYKGGLSGGGEYLALKNRKGEVVDSVFYDDDPPWPKQPDGGGPSLELINPLFDNSLPSSWAASKIKGGTPGLPNSVLQ